MASDENYMSFLDKANKDPSEGYAKAGTAHKEEQGFKATEQGVEIPQPIARVVAKDLFYVSDADEPFEAVALKLGGDGLPDEGSFSPLVFSFFSFPCDSGCLDSSMMWTGLTKLTFYFPATYRGIRTTYQSPYPERRRGRDPGPGRLGSQRAV